MKYKFLKNILFLLPLFVVFLGLESVSAKGVCLHTDQNMNVMEVDYDYFCGNTSKNKCYSHFNANNGSGVSYELSSIPLDGYDLISDKNLCYASDYSFSFNGCYLIKNVDTGSTFYANKESDFTSNGIYVATKVSDKYCRSYSSDYIPNYQTNGLISCGEGMIDNIPQLIPKVIHIVYLILQIIVPVLLALFGTIDFLKAIFNSKEDEIKKGQQAFIKRIIAAAVMFFIFAIVKLIISVAGDDSNKSNIIACASCLINNDENCVAGVN